MNYTVISKRKIKKLISERIVSDWDDPRLFTLPALKRRGFPPQAINSFVAQMGLTGALTSVDPSMLEASVRDLLNLTAPRVMAVLDPLKVTITNLPFLSTTLSVPDFPADESSSKHEVTFGKVIYIERSDFKEREERGYRRLTRSQGVGLRHAGFVVTVSDVVKDKSGEVVEVIVTAVSVESVEKKPKAFIHWVSDPVECEVRLYERLFFHKHPEDPALLPAGFISDCNPHSLQLTHALIDRSLLGAPLYSRFQFERNGFFSVDPDSTGEKLVFNRTVSLKEDKAK